MRREERVRMVLGLIYLLASLINLTTALLQVEIYREWQYSALLPFYRYFMESVSTPLLTITIFLVALYQTITGLSLLSRDYVQLGLLMALLFHLVILPWGYFTLPGLLFLIPLYYLSRSSYNFTTSLF